MHVKLQAAKSQPAARALLIWLLVSAGAAAAPAPIDVLRDCAHDAPQGARGIKKLDAACPNLNEALRALGMDALLPRGWGDTLNPQALLDLAELSSRYDASRVHANPSIASLREIVDTVNGKPAPPARTWWQRLGRWLKDWLAGHDSALSGWVSRWLDDAAKSASLLKFAGYLSMALIVAAAVAIIINELRAAGVWDRGRRARSAARQPAPAAAPVPAGNSPAKFPGDGVAELLRQLVARLAQTGRVANERSLTHRELIARSRLDTAAQRSVFASVAGSAEQLKYGAAAATPEQLRPVLEEGRSLLAQLENTLT